MQNLINDQIGFIHLVFSSLAIVFGSIVLLKKKGTKAHKVLGYIYFISMVIVLITAFLIYRLYGKFGIFHYAAIASSLTLILGMLPVWFRKSIKKWIYVHLTFMYWSVIGLYIAFIAEILTRIPDSNFLGMVYLSFIVISLLGLYFFKKYLKTSIKK